MDAVVIGGCVVDLISYADRFPVVGETLIGTNFSKGFGGKGANQCVMISRLGGKTAMIGKLGEDTFGQEYLQCFEINKINAEHVTMTKEMHTSAASICVTKNGENSIIYIPGANECLRKEDIHNAKNIISKAKVLLCCYECPREILMEALQIAYNCGVYTVVNAAPASHQCYDELYPLCNIFCVNEIEAQAATGQRVKTIQDAMNVCEILLSKGCRTVIITLGAKGAVYHSQGKPNAVHIPVRDVKAVDTTGAGDAFLGSFAYYAALHPNLSLEEKIFRSCEIASVSVLSPGTQMSFPFRKDLPQKFFE